MALRSSGACAITAGSAKNMARTTVSQLPRCLRTSFRLFQGNLLYVLTWLSETAHGSRGYRHAVNREVLYDRTEGGDRPNNNRPDGNCKYRGAHRQVNPIAPEVARRTGKSVTPPIPSSGKPATADEAAARCSALARASLRFPRGGTRPAREPAADTRARPWQSENTAGELAETSRFAREQQFCTMKDSYYALRRAATGRCIVSIRRIQNSDLCNPTISSNVTRLNRVNEPLNLSRRRALISAAGLARIRRPRARRAGRDLFHRGQGGQRAGQRLRQER